MCLAVKFWTDAGFTSSHLGRGGPLLQPHPLLGSASTLKVILKASQNTLRGLIRKDCSAAHSERTHLLKNRSFSQTPAPRAMELSCMFVRGHSVHAGPWTPNSTTDRLAPRTPCGLPLSPSPVSKDQQTHEATYQCPTVSVELGLSFPSIEKFPPMGQKRERKPRDPVCLPTPTVAPGTF